MDPLTHAVMGASFAAGAAALRQRTREPAVATSQESARESALWVRRYAALAGAVAGLAPDIDAFIQSGDDALLVLDYHRHFTHALLLPSAAAAASGPPTVAPALGAAGLAGAAVFVAAAAGFAGAAAGFAAAGLVAAGFVAGAAFSWARAGDAETSAARAMAPPMRKTAFVMKSKFLVLASQWTDPGSIPSQPAISLRHGPSAFKAPSRLGSKARIAAIP